MPKYFSGRVKRTPQSGLTSDRYQYLGLDQAEPNLGDPPEVDNIPPGQQYQIVSLPTHPGERFWKQVGGGVVPGAITIREEGTILPNVLGVSSITDINIKGNILTAVGTLDADGNPGTGVTITAAPVGNDHEVLFNNNGEFGAASGLSYDNTNSRVGIASTQPQETLDIDGTLFITGNVFDKDHDSGDENQVLVRSATGGLVWADQSGATAVAAGKTTQVQFHNDDGNLGGATKLVYDYTNNRIGIGSTQPKKLLDVLGDSQFKGRTDFDGNVHIDGVLTYEDVTNVDSIGIITARKGVRISAEGLIVAGVTTLSTTRFPDSTSLYFGDDDDLQILHDGNDSIINDNVAGSLKLQQGGNTRLEVTGMGVTVSGVTTTNVLSVTGLVTSHLIPSPASVGLFNLGSEDNRWDYVYVNNIDTGSWNPVVVDTEQLRVSGLSTFIGLTRHQDGIVVTSGVSTFAGNVKVNTGNFVEILDNRDSTGSTVGALVVHGGVGISKLSNFGEGINVIGHTELDDVNISGIVTAAKLDVGISTLGIASATSLYVSGLSTFHEVATYEGGINVTSGVSTFTTGVNVLGFSTFVGISSFESDVSFNAGIRDKDGDLGNTGWLLESTGSGKVNWVNPQGLTVENASKIGVGSVYGGTPLTSAGINTYFVTFVPDNNPIDDRENELLYTTGLFVYDPIGQRVGIGTTIPTDTLSVTGITTFNGEVYFNSGVTGITSIGWNPSSSALEFKDDVKATFGDSSDLQIYHDTINSEPSSVVEHNNSNASALYLSSNQRVEITDQEHVNLSLRFNYTGNYETELFRGTVKKLETTDAGIKVTGLTTTGSLRLDGAFYDSSNSYGASSGYILQTNQASGVSWVNPTDLAFESANKIGIGSINAEATGIGTHFITFVDTNNPHDGREYELLYSTGLFVYDPQDGGRVGIGTTIPSDTLSVTGITSFKGDVYFNENAWVRDDQRLYFGEGTGNPSFSHDFMIYHQVETGAGQNDTHFDATRGNTILKNNDNVYISNRLFTKISANFDTDASVELSYDGTPKFATSGIGITVTGLTSTTSLMVTGQLYDKDGEAGDANQILSSTGTGIDWIDPDGLTAANAAKVGIGTTNNAGGTDVQEYYVPFVRDNNPHNARQNEFLYSDSKLVYRYTASDDVGGVGINTDVVGQELNVFSREFAGVRVKSSRTTAETMDTMTQIGGIQFADSDHSNYPNGRTMSSVVGTLRGDLILKTGHDATDNGSIDRVTITPVGHVGIGTTNPIAENITTALDVNTRVLAVGIVTADKFYGDGSGLTGVTGSGIAAVEVKQYSDDLSQNDPRTERSCDALDAPITVATNAGTAVIGIGSTSNAYGNRYIGDTEPTGNLCDGDIWYDTSSAGSGGVNGSTGITRIALIKDAKNYDVNGGGFAKDGWRDRDLTEIEDPQGFVNFNSNGGTKTTTSTGLKPGYWSLQPGTYKIEWSAPAFEINRHQTKLVYSTTEAQISEAGLHASASSVEGSTENTTWGSLSQVPTQTRSFGSKVIKITDRTWFKIMHFCTEDAAANNTNSFGRRLGGANDGNPDNIYTEVRIEDLATAVKEVDIVNTGITKVAKVEEIGAYGNSGAGTFTASTWITRSLTNVTDPKNIGITLNTTDNYITVPAGTYSIKWSAPALNCTRHVARLLYSTSSTFSFNSAATTDVYAPVAYTFANNSQTQSRSTGFLPTVTFTGTTYIKVQHYSDVGASNGDGLGVSSPWSSAVANASSPPIWTTIEIEDLATAVKDNATYVEGTSKVAILKDQKNYTVAGGTFNQNTWVDRDLTVEEDPQNFVNFTAGGSQSSPSPGNTPGYWSLPAGTYKIDWSAVGYMVGNHTCWLVWSTTQSEITTAALNANISAAGDYEEGSAARASASTDESMTDSSGYKVITISQPTYFKLLHRCTDSQTTNGLGRPISQDGVLKNIYTQVRIEDLATAVKDQAPAGSDVPVGGIIMYHGTKTDLDAMANWKLCDGTIYGSVTTPNLKDKFVIGADSWSTAGDGQWETNVTGSGTQSGGSKDAVVVSHTHTHSRLDPTNDDNGTPVGTGGSAGSSFGSTYTTGAATNEVSGANQNLPPYFALAYIMRIS